MNIVTNIVVENAYGVQSNLSVHINQDKLATASMGNALLDTGCAERWIERASVAPCVAQDFATFTASTKMSLAFALAFAERFVLMCIDSLSNSDEAIDRTFATCDASGIRVSDARINYQLSHDDTLSARLTGFAVQ
ncbi:MAG: hypothetical protein LWW76_02685 [Burkholderiales bacterium]|nr:hypothetical protein [Burkholderiales bacterium]